MKTRPVKLIIMATVLLSAVLWASCSDDDPAAVNKDELNVTIEAANLLLSTTSEGVAAGNFQRGSQDVLQDAVDIAQVIADLPEAKQETVTGANANLVAEIAVYNGKIIVAIDPTNLVGQWTFDELTSAAAGTVVKDYSGNGRDGTIKVGNSGLLPLGGVRTASLGSDRYGVSGKALLLDKGANVEIPYNTALNSPSISISAWVKLLEVRNNRFIGLHSWIGYKFEVQDGNRPFATIGHSGGSYDHDAGVSIGQNAWYHLVVTYTAGSMKFYINGILIPSGTWTDTPNPAALLPTPYNLVLGCDFPSDKYAATAANFDVVGHVDYHKIPAEWGGYLHGYLDEVRIYKSVLTATQVTSIYDLEKPN